MVNLIRRRESGLARQFDEMAKEWRDIAMLAARKPDLIIRDAANARAECWDIAADMAEKWYLAEGAEASQAAPDTGQPAGGPGRCPPT